MNKDCGGGDHGGGASHRRS